MLLLRYSRQRRRRRRRHRGRCPCISCPCAPSAVFFARPVIFLLLLFFFFLFVAVVAALVPGVGAFAEGLLERFLGLSFGPQG